jgi:hypothetical protein
VIEWAKLHGREATAMGRRMDVCAVFNFDSLDKTFGESPELSLNILFRYRALGIGDEINRYSACEMLVLEMFCLFLKLLQRVDTAFFESKLACAHKTF